MDPQIKQLTNQILQDNKTRRALSKNSHFWFFHIYLNEYIKYPTADFQKEIFELTEDESIRNLVIVAFRGSAKTTILTTSYPIWSVIGKPQKKFVVIFSQTRSQAKDHFADIKREFENNELLKKELGPFRQEDKWDSSALILPKFNAKIMAASIEQGVRGLKFGPHRPDLIICDDVEDINSVRSQDSRDKTHKWFLSEVLPLGDKNTKIVTVGNLLHEDSLIVRLKESMENKQLKGVFKSYPFMDKNENPLWSGKFKTKQDAEELIKNIGHEITWQREYMLRIVPDEGQLIKPEWIHYYDELPNPRKLRYVGTGIDLAVSQKETAHYTAMVSAKVYGNGQDAKMYILPNPINQRIDFPQIVKQIVLLNGSFGQGAEFYAESVAAQEYLMQNVQQEYGYINIQGINVAGADKRSRLAATTYQIQSGNVLFPKQGAELLIRQLLGFGIEKNDDLCDAFSLMVNEITKKESHTEICEIFCLSRDYDDD